MQMMHFFAVNSFNSLRALNITLTKFGKFSGYKVNKTKSTLMGLAITVEARKQVKGIVSVLWKAAFKYLGLKLTAAIDSAALIELNFSLFINDV